MIGEATKKETAAAIKTPSNTVICSPFGATAKNAMIEPGEDGPTKPAPINE